MASFWWAGTPLPNDFVGIGWEYYAFKQVSGDPPIIKDGVPLLASGSALPLSTLGWGASEDASILGTGTDWCTTRVTINGRFEGMARTTPLAQGRLQMEGMGGRPRESFSTYLGGPTILVFTATLFNFFISKGSMLAGNQKKVRKMKAKPWRKKKISS